ncbi:hypothetical protein [Frankia sp. Cr1]|uniref:hypothetical protein n=1 Tax=Frankia sp. Cr1 TaxID=3073931 RepID=UPI002AD2DAC2|nr:hypothetical protein [Frankia sp. Cr1]
MGKEKAFLARFETRYQPGELEAARAADLGEFARWHDAERLVGNLYRAYREMSEDHARTPMDHDAMWRNTVACLSRPLRSRA